MFDRAKSRLIIKEVRSLPNVWLTKHYQPRIIILVRYPVAVALSYKKIGWHDLTGLAEWKHHGGFQACSQRLDLDILRDQPGRYCAIRYEAICEDSAGEFR